MSVLLLLMELTCNGPASSPSVLSVGGVIIAEDAVINHAKPYHGCRGKTFEGKRVPEILAPAENLVLPMPFHTLEERQNHYTAPNVHLPEDYARTEGTSFAGPIILGCAACIWQAQPHWTANQVKSAIISSSIRNENWDDLNAGLIDVAAALEAVPPQTSFRAMPCVGYFSMTVVMFEWQLYLH
ncbi:S8 family serine peptidase [Paenibacillus lycopersici]|uniref:S8 family serine peptidase n=1 Tax=Paenibacillus lycopersici TaxID=2704462 RepID=A0A6C0G1Y4_9BACL|nr:S8 family serine peptidase [Paenibacillus lycopersici]QHT61344.1 S8 family serine peptidase [Paenibacillus lycopersici]